MISRVSDLATFTDLRLNFGRLRARLDDLSEQIATGQRVNRPSDDPAGAAVLVRSLSVLDAFDADRRAASFARGFLGVEDALLDDAGFILDRARELATQHANGLFGDGERAAAAEEVHALLDAVVAIGNSELGGRRLFSGGESVGGAAPFVDPDDPGFDPGNPYVGASRGLEVEIGGGELVRVTTPGDQVFGGAIAALADLEDRLRAGTSTADALPLLEAAATALHTERASVGTRLGRVDARDGQIDDAELVVDQTVAATRGADLVSLVTELAQLQAQLQVAAAASQRVLESSLVNLLTF